MSTEKLLIDADPGIGDALAVALALVDPKIDVLAVTGCGGRVSGEQASLNLQTVVSIIDPDRWPRIGWSDSPAIGVPRHGEGTILRDGPKGLGQCEPFDVELHQRHDSARVLIDLVRTYPDQLTLLTLGPLTNVHAAMERYPEFLSQLKELICLGGSIHGTGDISPAAEFNIHSDPEAARAVLTSPATKTLVPLETAGQLMLSFEQYDRIAIDAYSRLGRLVTQLLPFGLRENRQLLGLEGVQLPDVVALAAVSLPRLFERESLPVDVELSGELTRGMTVFDRRGNQRYRANIDVLTDVDVQGVLDDLRQRLRAADV